MITCQQLTGIFKKNGVDYFTGVPDSTFKEWMSYLNDNHGRGLINRIAAIERDAVGWAAGYNVATGRIPCVYMQNSGLGNTVNPITSLTDPEVYKIPLLLMVGWRGEPGVHDEPQHIKMGRITSALLDVLEIRHDNMPDNAEAAEKAIGQAVKYITETGKTFAFIVRSGIFEEYKGDSEPRNYEMTREDALKAIVDTMDGDEVIVSTTGKTSRELFEYREAKKVGHESDFLMVGSMGLAASLGAEIALQKPARKIFVFDGDGALLMSAGALSAIGFYSPNNLFHIVFDNGSHDSTGGQPTTSLSTDFRQLALANSYKLAGKVETKQELQKLLADFKEKSGPKILVVKVKKGSRKDLGRPTTTPQQNKEAFINFVRR